MPINLELKIKTDNFTEIKELLTDIKAEYKGILNQRDVYYQSISGLLKLRTVNGSQELIRYDRDESGENRFSDYHVMHITAPDAEKFFNEVLTTETVIEKKRELYIFNNTRIHLDTVTDLGNFLELETLVISDKDDAEKRFAEIVALLKLDMSKQIKASYKNLKDNLVQK
jgi:adenylate cyclase class IV